MQDNRLSLWKTSMTFDRVVCPICLINDFTELAGNPYPAVRCKSCGLGIECHVRIDPKSYENYAAVRDNGGEDLSPLGRWHHDFAVAVDRIEQLKHVLPVSGRWLDVGCNAGAMLAAAARRGWSVCGIELTQRAVDIARFATGCRVATFDEWVSRDASGLDYQSNIVSMFDVIEHAVDPIVLIRNACACLHIDGVDRGGVLIIEVPDLDVTDAESFGHWKHRRITASFTEHVYHFSERALVALFANHVKRFKPVHVARPIEGKLQMVFRAEDV
jgi:SAM-dependent methyltransferase